jgi:outer membrane protein assembly factor BamB
MWGPPAKDAPAFEKTYGTADDGSVMAFRVEVENDKPKLVPAWRSRNMHVPDPPVIANGIVFAIQTGENTQQNPGGDKIMPGRGRGGAGRGGAGRGGRGGQPGLSPEAIAQEAAKRRATPVSNLVLYAFDAQTGKELYSSEKIMTSWVHFSEPVVAMGKVFVVSWDGHVYAFGLK